VTNLRCLKHPDYKGADFTSNNCYNCANIFVQALRGRQHDAIMKAAKEKITKASTPT
jgi:hypothetical protein